MRSLFLLVWIGLWVTPARADLVCNSVVTGEAPPIAVTDVEGNRHRVTVTTEGRVRDFEIDPFGHVNTQHYVGHYLEQEGAMRRSLGLEQDFTSRFGLFLSVKRVEAEFRSSLTQGQSFTVLSRLEAVAETSYALGMAILSETGEVISVARVEVRCADARSKKDVLCPMELLDRFWSTAPHFRSAPNIPPMAEVRPLALPPALGRPLSLTTSHRGHFSEVGPSGTLHPHAYLGHVIGHRFTAQREQLGLGLREIGQLPVFFAIKMVDIKFSHPIVGDDLFNVTSQATGVGNRAGTITTRITGPGGTEHASATLLLLCVDRATKAPVAWPSEVMRLFFEIP